MLFVTIIFKSTKKLRAQMPHGVYPPGATAKPMSEQLAIRVYKIKPFASCERLFVNSVLVRVFGIFCIVVIY